MIYVFNPIEKDKSVLETFYDVFEVNKTITDTMLLKLICLVNEYSDIVISEIDYNKLKYAILFNCVNFYTNIGFPETVRQFKNKVHDIVEGYKRDE